MTAMLNVPMVHKKTGNFEKIHGFMKLLISGMLPQENEICSTFSNADNIDT